MDITGLLGILAGIAVATALFLASYLLFIKNKEDSQFKILGFVFLVISLRIAKSIWFFIFYDVAPIGLSMGYLGLSSIGPLIYLYLRSCREEKIKLKPWDTVHFIIPLVGVIISLIATLGVVTYAYKTTTVILVLYVIAGWWMHWQLPYPTVKLSNWNRDVLAAVSLVTLAFVYQHLSETMFSYAIGAGIASIPIYYILIQAIVSHDLFKKPNHSELASEVLQKVVDGFEKKALYRQKNLSLNQFADHTSLPTYLISKSVSQLYQKSFPETVNYFRIKEVQAQLTDPKIEFIKIEALAYEVGFNSPSAFYAAFKKTTNMTPKQYQQAHKLQQAN